MSFRGAPRHDPSQPSTSAAVQRRRDENLSRFQQSFPANPQTCLWEVVNALQCGQSAKVRFRHEVYTLRNVCFKSLLEDHKEILEKFAKISGTSYKQLCENLRFVAYFKKLPIFKNADSSNFFRLVCNCIFFVDKRWINGFKQTNLFDEKSLELLLQKKPVKVSNSERSSIDRKSEESEAGTITTYLDSEITASTSIAPPNFETSQDENLRVMHHWNHLSSYDKDFPCDQEKRFRIRYPLYRKKHKVYNDYEYFQDDVDLKPEQISFRLRCVLHVPSFDVPSYKQDGYFKYDPGKTDYEWFLYTRYMETNEDCATQFAKIRPPNGLPIKKGFRKGTLTPTECFNFHITGYHIHAFFDVWEEENARTWKAPDGQWKGRRYLVDMYNQLMFPLYVHPNNWPLSLLWAYRKYSMYGLKLMSMVKRHTEGLARAGDALFAEYPPIMVDPHNYDLTTDRDRNQYYRMICGDNKRIVDKFIHTIHKSTSEDTTIYKRKRKSNPKEEEEYFTSPRKTTPPLTVPTARGRGGARTVFKRPLNIPRDFGSPSASRESTPAAAVASPPVEYSPAASLLSNQATWSSAPSTSSSPATPSPRLDLSPERSSAPPPSSAASPSRSAPLPRSSASAPHVPSKLPPIPPFAMRSSQQRPRPPLPPNAPGGSRAPPPVYRPPTGSPIRTPQPYPHRSPIRPVAPPPPNQLLPVTRVSPTKPSILRTPPTPGVKRRLPSESVGSPAKRIMPNDGWGDNRRGLGGVLEEHVDDKTGPGEDPDSRQNVWVPQDRGLAPEEYAREILEHYIGGPREPLPPPPPQPAPVPVPVPAPKTVRRRKSTGRQGPEPLPPTAARNLALTAAASPRQTYPPPSTPSTSSTVPPAQSVSAPAPQPPGTTSNLPPGRTFSGSNVRVKYSRKEVAPSPPANKYPVKQLHSTTAKFGINGRIPPGAPIRPHPYNSNARPVYYNNSSAARGKMPPHLLGQFKNGGQPGTPPHRQTAPPMYRLAREGYERGEGATSPLPSPASVAIANRREKEKEEKGAKVVEPVKPEKPVVKVVVEDHSTCQRSLPYSAHVAEHDKNRKLQAAASGTEYKEKQRWRKDAPGPVTAPPRQPSPAPVRRPPVAPSGTPVVQPQQPPQRPFSSSVPRPPNVPPIAAPTVMPPSPAALLASTSAAVIGSVGLSNPRQTAPPIQNNRAFMDAATAARTTALLVGAVDHRPPMMALDPLQQQQLQQQLIMAPPAQMVTSMMAPPMPMMIAQEPGRKRTPIVTNTTPSRNEVTVKTIASRVRKQHGTMTPEQLSDAIRNEQQRVMESGVGEGPSISNIILNFKR
ncbi:hypothetical protein B9Z55_013337 [Caenorhabditis nigoni]|uniref:Uncharacterized protein n=1 Tax=Caenorhabditis nigoni TaxID=1611254 RepID=A0A2G5U1I5_9PELO|nr:hypothetical protein B9Z55_013337 [Caenorhabditis nigoni]